MLLEFYIENLFHKFSSAWTKHKIVTGQYHLVSQEVISFFHNPLRPQIKEFHALCASNVQDHDKKMVQAVITLIYFVLFLGHYIYFVQPPSVLTLSREEMCSLMVNELTTGCVDQPDVKCGFIGEVGSGWPLHGGSDKTAMEYTHFPNAFLVLLHTWH
jgi:hypothetical protein